MRGVSLKELGDKPKPEDKLDKLIASVESIQNRIDLIETRISGTETAVSERDNSAQKSLSESIKAGNQLIEKSMSSQGDALQGPLQSVMEAVSTMTSAIQEFANKQVEVTVQSPEIVLPASPNKVYKIKRHKHTDRIDEIEERDA